MGRGWLVALFMLMSLAARAQTLGEASAATGTQGALAGTGANGAGSTLQAVRRAVAPSSSGSSWAHASGGRPAGGSAPEGWTTGSSATQHTGTGASGWAKGGWGSAGSGWARAGDGAGAHAR